MFSANTKRLNGNQGLFKMHKKNKMDRERCHTQLQITYSENAL